MESLLKELEKLEGYSNQIQHTEILPAKKKEFGKLEKPLPVEIQEYLNDKDIELYKHQAALINLVRNGENVVITTPTASGKTLAFNIPVFEALLQNPDARALYIYPMKALTNDQFKVLREMEEGTGIKISPNIYDGDTPRNNRPGIRENSRIILTNPYGLHYYLPWHRRWKTFFQNLEFIVIDESHTYRGIFGSNVAMVIRRILRICEKYGASPKFILSSATIANPEEHSRNLTGQTFKVVSEDGSEIGQKTFVFWNPPIIDEDLTRRSTHQETKDLFLYCLQHGLQTLCFTVSRKMAELITMWSKEELYEKNSSLATSVESYRAGYRPEERRKIEHGLRSGKLAGVVSTNALELGIDIGSLDCVIMSGYPGTIISSWQQAGRAGRLGDESIVFLVAFNNPLDQYFMNHPEDFFRRSTENAIIDLENPYISLGQIMCAANEKPLTAKDNFYFPKVFPQAIEALSEAGIIRETSLGWVYAGRARPEANVKLTNISEHTVRVLYRGHFLETMDIIKAYREVHEGAILLHQGEKYFVTDFDIPNLEAIVQKTDVNYYTEALKNIEIAVNEIYEETNEKFKMGVGKVDVTEYYTHYRLMSYEEVLDIKPLDLPPLNFSSEGFWITISSDIVTEIEEQKLDLAGGIHAIEHAMIAVAPIHAMCDKRDLGGVSTEYHLDTQKPTIFVYDGFEGGIGISEKLYSLLPDLLETTLKLVKDCKCHEGCPSCIYSPKCGNNNEPLDKKTSILLLEKLLMSIATIT